MIELAVHRGVIVGHCASTPVFLWVDGHEFPAALAVTAMTAPAYRGQGIHLTLTERLYRRMANDGMVMVWGFPNRNSHRSFIREMKWFDLHEIPSFSIDLKDPAFRRKQALEVITLNAVDDRFDSLWASVNSRFRVWVRRDQTYVRWRFERNPINTYALKGYVRQGKLLGYAIWKRYQNSADLVDLVYQDDEIAVELILAVAANAARNGAESLSLWLNFSLPLHHELEKLGFVNGGPITYFGGRVLRPGVSKHVFAMKNWYVMKGDSDVY